MSYQVLARRWRPRTFDAMVGQEHVVRALRNALEQGRVHHAFLFTGTRGVGKTTVARIIAKCLNCESGVTAEPCGACSACRDIDDGRFPDLLEIDAASRAKVDETRELMDNVQYSPGRGRYKVYLIDEVHMFSPHSFNALLKTLEEPPPHVKFLLATTDPQKLPVTVLSRCLQFSLKRLAPERIGEQLARILAEEGVEAEPEAVRVLARAADGSMRDGLSLLDQAIAYGGGSVAAAEVREMLGSGAREALGHLAGSLASGDARAVMAGVDEMARTVSDWHETLGELLGLLHRVALAQALPATEEEDDDEDASLAASLAQRLTPEDVQLWYQIGLMGRRDLPLAPDSRSGFEMVLLRMVAFRPAGAAPVPEASPVDAAGSGRGAEEAPPARSATTEREDWPRIVEAMGLSGLARALAQNCALLELGESHARLALAPGHRQLTGTQVRDKLEAALAHHFGKPMRLTIELEESPADTPARRSERTARERHERAVRSLESDEAVRDLCDTFGTTIDPALVRPAAGDGEGGGTR